MRARLAEQRDAGASLLAPARAAPGLAASRATARAARRPARAARGPKHGPYFVLSTRSGGRGGFEYLEDAQAGRGARDLVERHREFQDGLRRLQAR